MYQDIILIIPAAIFIGTTKPHHKLTKKMPPGKLMGWAVFSSVFWQLVLIFIFQMVLLEILYRRLWYSPINPLGDHLVDNHVNSSLIKHCAFYFMTMVIVFSKGAPWRRPIYCNWWLTGCIIIVTAVNIWLCFEPAP